MVGELQKEIAPFKDTCGCSVEEGNSQGRCGGWEEDTLHRVHAADLRGVGMERGGCLGQAKSKGVRAGVSWTLGSLGLCLGSRIRHPPAFCSPWVARKLYLENDRNQSVRLLNTCCVPTWLQASLEVWPWVSKSPSMHQLLSRLRPPGWVGAGTVQCG